MNAILDADMKDIYAGLTDSEVRKFHGSTVLLTGPSGFLGFMLTQFLLSYRERLGIRKVIGVDNFYYGKPVWLENLEKVHGENFYVTQADLCHDAMPCIEYADQVDFIFHMASIASPSYYRKHPLQTVDANVNGLRQLLDYYHDKRLKGLLFFSSSEIYGNPPADKIPTDEEYWGNVSCLGPRACYDEAKRFGETLCYIFSISHGMPIVIVRPFNNYGPGLRLGDKRLPADLAKAVMERQDIVIYSDGSPTRTFCYISDAVTGYLKAVCHGKFDYFNIGMDKPELSVKDFATLYVETARTLFSYDGGISYQVHADPEYLSNNPSRRVPDIEKARIVLGYEPKHDVASGIERYLRFLMEEASR